MANVHESVDRLSVSVALCTHNGARYIAEQLRSILHQTVMPAQVVVSDDASTDATVQIVRDVFSRFRADHNGTAPVLTLLRNAEPLRVTANFEQATLACTGDLIALSDQDDVWVPERLARMIDEFHQRPELTLLHSDARLVDDQGNPLGGTLSEAIGFTARERRHIHEGNAVDVLLRRNVVTGATTVFRRSLLDAAAPFPEAWVHDEWLAMIASIVGRVNFLPDTFTDYRQHDTNQIGASKPSLTQKIGRVSEPRAQRNRRLLARAAALESQLHEIAGVSDRMIMVVAAKRRHEEARNSLPRARALRVFPIIRMALRGGYRRFGRARYDIMRDLLQPAD